MSERRNSKGMRYLKMISARDRAELINKTNRFLRENNAYLIHYEVYGIGAVTVVMELMYEINV